MTSWRSIQLKDKNCDQDNIILDIVNQRPVKYVGFDKEFEARLNVDDNSACLVLVINYPVWFSDIVKLCRQHISSTVTEVYIGINRYYLLGNDTSYVINSSQEYGRDILNAVKKWAIPENFKIVNQGTHDADRGAMFNFVQPLTWMYCHRE